jgi:hypothetical protein
MAQRILRSMAGCVTVEEILRTGTDCYTTYRVALHIKEPC